MKKTKSLLLLITVFLLSVCCVVLCACKDTQDQNDTVSILFKNGETVQTLSVDITDFDEKGTIYDLFVSAKEKNTINPVILDEDTDLAYLQGIYGMLANNDNYEYIAIYTDIASLTDNTNLTVAVSGINFYYSDVGIKGLLLQKDAHYLFSLEQWTTQEAVDLNNAKTAAKAELDSYAVAENYRAAEQTILATAIANGKTAVDNAADTSAVSTALANAKLAINEIKTNAELTAEEALELTTAKTNAKNALDNYVNANDYRSAEQTTLATAIANGKTAIDTAADTAAVSTALANAETAIDNIKTDAELTAEEALDLLTAKTNAKSEINSYKALPANNVNQFEGFEAAENTFAVIYGQIDDSIDNATTVSAVNSAVANAKTLIDGMIITVKCTFTDDGEFLFTTTNDAVANMTVTVPYFDLAEYDLSQFYRYEADSYENGGAYIGDEVLLQPTLMHAFIYMHVMYARNGIDDYTVTGSSCSSYMSEFWGLDENLNYYVNYKFPLMAAGWGSTSDYILLEDDMHVDVAHWSNWSFWSTGVKFVYTDTDTYEVSAGEKIDFNFKYWASDMMNPDPVETAADITWLAGTVYNAGESLSLKVGQSDITDSDNDGVLDYTFSTAGTYYIVFRDVDIVGGCDVANDIQYYVGSYAVKVVVSE